MRRLDFPARCDFLTGSGSEKGSVKIGASVVNVAWMTAQLGGYWRFRRALGRVQPTQETLLMGYLQKNAATEFGRRHGFATIRSVREYQERVPLSTYEDYIDSIQRLRSGAGGILTAARVNCLEPTSGSTQAAKLIPYTRDLQSEFGRAIAPWMFDLALSAPANLGGPAYWSITPAMTQPVSSEGDDANGTAVGFEADSAYLGGWLGWLANLTLVDCNDLRHIQDVEDFRRRTLVRLLSEGDLRLISVWHPTFLTLLLDTLVASWGELVDDVSRGLPPAGAVRASRANPARARQLARADPSRPASIWPRLTLVSCWGDGHAATLIPDLQIRLPEVRVQPKGLIATEAFVSLPFAGRHPLAICSHFFEFIDDRKHARTAWELAEGESYSVVVTTSGGLYRYQLRDRITVDGFVGMTPSIRFLGKEDSVSDLCGEKLSEEWVARVLSRLLPVLAPRTTFALLAPETEGGTPQYVLYIASDEVPAPALGETLEGELALNPNYAHCVRLGQLRSVAVARVDAAAAGRYLERLRQGGRRLGNIKPTALSTLTGWRGWFGMDVRPARDA